MCLLRKAIESNQMTCGHAIHRLLNQIQSITLNVNMRPFDHINHWYGLQIWLKAEVLNELDKCCEASNSNFLLERFFLLKNPAQSNACFSSPPKRPVGYFFFFFSFYSLNSTYLAPLSLSSICPITFLFKPHLIYTLPRLYILSLRRDCFYILYGTRHLEFKCRAKKKEVPIQRNCWQMKGVFSRTLVREMRISRDDIHQRVSLFIFFQQCFSRIFVMLNNIEKQKQKSRDFIPHRGVSVDTIRWACFITQIIFEKKKMIMFSFTSKWRMPIVWMERLA